MRDWAQKQPHIGFVPTMGALHEGHLSLARTAKRQCAVCVMSIFVNPTQFGPNEDFARYPRNEDRDFELAEQAEVDCVFAPAVEEIYPRRTTFVRLLDVGNEWEGAYRPGHFDGVATVVLKLFNIVRPEMALFGLKDLQQCAVIRRMVEDLDVPVVLSFEETIRDVDGLALSSRNAYLTPEQREVAPELFRIISESAKRIALDQQSVDTTIGIAIQSLADTGFQVDYLAMVDGRTMKQQSEPNEESRIIVAARIGAVRLIDNVAVY